jgi:hypothetical protein
MRLFRHLRPHALAAGIALAGALSAARPLAAAPVPDLAPADVSETAIAASNAKVDMAYRALVALWSGRFAELGQRFAPPALYAYRGAVRDYFDDLKK